MRPHSAVGCWYNSSYVVSSDHKLLAHTGGVSASLLWMNRLAPELANDFTLAGMRCLFKFYNTGGDLEALTYWNEPIQLKSNNKFNFEESISLIQQNRNIRWC